MRRKDPLTAHCRSQDLSKGGGGQNDSNRGYLPNCYVDLHAVFYFMLHFSDEQWNKINFKKVGFSTMAFQAKISSLRFHHLDIVGWRLKKRTPKGATGTSGPPSSYDIVAAPLSSQTLGLTSSDTWSFYVAVWKQRKKMRKISKLSCRRRSKLCFLW